MKRVIQTMDTLPFWVAVFVASVLFVFAYAFVISRDAAARNADVIARQQQQLVELCETIRVLDAVTVQQQILTVDTLAGRDVPPWARVYLARRAEILGRTHDELAESHTCRQIE